MNEHEIRDALRGVMVASSPPPPMDAEAALQTARRAHRRRQTTLAGAGTALAVAAIAVTAVVVVPGRTVVGPAAPPGAQGPQASDSDLTRMRLSRTAPVAPPAPNPGTMEPAKPTETDPYQPADPNPTAGPRYEQGAQLHRALVAVVPPGYTVAPFTSRSKYRAHDASFVRRVNGVEVWMYQASVLPTQGDRTGVLHALVQTPDLELSTEPCARLQGLAPCQVIDVGGKQVGVAGPGANDEWYAQYVYPDGTFVEISQSTRRTGDPDVPNPQPLEALPFTVQQLAELAVDPRFHLE